MEQIDFKIDFNTFELKNSSYDFVYRGGGTIMLAILVVKGTKYACNLGDERDQLCMQSWFRRGTNMPAISVTIGTIYDCNRI